MHRPAAQLCPDFPSYLHPESPQQLQSCAGYWLTRESITPVRRNTSASKVVRTHCELQRRPASSGFIVPWISPPQSGSVLPQGPAAFRGEAASSAGGSGGGGQCGLRRAPVSPLEAAEGGGQRRGRERRGGRERRRRRHPGRGAPRAVLRAGARPLPVMRRGGVVPRSLGEAVPVRAADEGSDFLHLVLIFLLGAAAFDGGSVQLQG